METKSEENEEKTRESIDSISTGAPSGKGDTSIIVQRVMEFAMSSDFEQSFEDFAKENAGAFECILDMEPGYEHPMEWHQIYLDYLKTFESKLEKFIEKIGYSLAEFYKDCQVILENGEVSGWSLEGYNPISVLY